MRMEDLVTTASLPARMGWRRNLAGGFAGESLGDDRIDVVLYGS